MSSLAKQEFSDSEDDEDYVPPAQDGSESSSDESEPETKRARVTSPERTFEDKETEKMARDALWASFQASVSNSTTIPGATSPKKTVKVVKKYLFAGEEVVEEVEVPEDSPEAKKWPLMNPSEESSPSGPTSSVPAGPSCTPSPAPAPASEPPVQKVPARKPGPRKPKTTLPSLPGSSKAKKLTTLEKSAMDWKVHVQAQEESGIKDELEANRRGGGYLEKVEFLKRVEERKEDNLESLKGSKRRRG